MVNYLETWAAFEKALSDAGSKLVVIDFTAKWCGPCRMIGPKFEAMAGEFPTAIFYKVDVDENSETAERNNVNCMPTFQFFKNGAKVHEFSGASEDKLREAIKTHC